MVANTNSPHTEKWVTGLVQHGISVHLFSIDPVAEPLAWRNMLSSHYAPDKKINFLPKKYFVLNRQLRKLIQQIQPQLLHAHYLTNYASLAALSSNLPLVVTAWGSDVFEYPLKHKLNAYLLKYVLRQSTAIISTSKVMAEELKRYTSKPIEIIPFGIKFNRFKTHTNNLEQGKYRIGIFKRLEPVYGIDRAIKAVAIAQSRLPSVKFELIIYGTGSQQQNLLNLIEQLKIQNSVKLMGWCSPEEVPNETASLDACIYLSERESFGVALLEGMAANLQLIVSDIPAFREVADSYPLVSFVPANDENASATAIITAIDRVRSNAVLSNNEAIQSRYDVDENIKQQIAVYQSILNP